MDGYISRQCIEENQDYDEVIKDYINSHKRAVPNWMVEHLESIGFQCMDDEDSESCQIFANGWHRGQTDDPKEILDSLKKEVGEKWFDENMQAIFAINSVGQFDVYFSLFVRKNPDID